MNPHLGDVIGEPLVPLRQTQRPRMTAPDWIVRGVHLFIAWVAVAIYGSLILVWLVLMFVFFTAKPSLGYALPWTCEQIRQYAQTHTAAELQEKARQLTPEQWRQVRACLERKT